MLILGIETSCDETAAAIVADAVIVRSNIVASQLDHALYGGVVPELAARRHVEALSWVVEAALTEAEACWEDIDSRWAIDVKKTRPFSWLRAQVDG